MTMSTSPSNSRDNPNIILNNGVHPLENNRKTKNIPLPLSHKHRTQSELQLSEDMETAEQRDLNMFYRLVNGIRERQMNLVRENESSTAAAAFYDPAHALTEAERSLAHIIHTRNAPVEKRNSGSSTTSFRINTTGRRSNNFMTNGHANLNPGVPILGGQQQQQEESGWSVGGFDSSSNLLSYDQHYQQQQPQHQQYASHNHGVAANVGVPLSPTSAIPTLHTAHSSNEMAEEGMFDFEL